MNNFDLSELEAGIEVLKDQLTRLLNGGPSGLLKATDSDTRKLMNSNEIDAQAIFNSAVKSLQESIFSSTQTLNELKKLLGQ